MKINFPYIFFLLISLPFVPPTLAQDRYHEKYYKAVEWRHIGPFRGGRSCAVTGTIHQSELYYMASTGGGVWKTTDAGENWKNISDGFFGGSMGSIEVSMADPNIIFAGEGEETVRGNMSPGRGIWKSEDAGKTWKSMGLKNSCHIVRIQCHPKNPDIVWAAALGNVFAPNSDRGIYKSTDGGNTWRKVLFANEKAGAIDLRIDPSNSRILFASTWNVQRTPYNLSSGGEGSALWKSTDGGETWKNISKNEGLPKGIWGKVCIAISPANSEKIYAMIENDHGGLFASSDGGLTWNEVNSDRKLRQRAWYFSRLCADPKDENTIYVQNVSLHKSTDGGKTFSTMNTRHADHHDMWIDPNDSKRMIVGNDGGAQISDDGGRRWSTQDNQPTAQFYRITTDNYFPFRIYAAQQDNSTIRISHRSSGAFITNKNWEETAGGESGFIAVDPTNPEIVYGGSYGGYLSRYDHKNKINRNINVWPDNPIGHGAEKLKYRFQWNFPIFFSPHNPKRLYAASNHLHVTENEGQSWTTISPDLTRKDTSKLKSSGGPITKDNTSVEYYCTIFAAAESSLVKDLLWVGSDDGLVHISRNGGKEWENVTPPTLPAWTMINSIEPDPHHAGGCYIAATSYKSGDFKPYIFKTEDYGKTWTSISKGIAIDHFTRVVRADPQTKGLLFAGTEYGAYISFDDGLNWKSFQLNLPIVPITDLIIKDDFLIAATQGRSIWMIDDLGVIRQLKKNIFASDQFVYKPKPTFRMEGAQVQTQTQGINHARHVMFYFYIDTLMEKDTVQIICLDKKRDTVCVYANYPITGQHKTSIKSGSNLALLDFQYPEAKTFDGMVMWWASLAGPRALPGNYTILLQSKKKTDSTVVTLIKDPTYNVTDQEIESQFKFITAIRAKVDEAHKVIIELRDVRNQLQEVTSRIIKNETHDTLFKVKQHLDSTMNSIESDLYQTKSKSGQDPINYPIKLTNKLAHLTALYAGGSFPPTDQAEEYRKEISSLIDVQLKQWELCKQNELRLFNELYRSLGLPVVKPKDLK